jgi:hypothetical protein
MTVHTVVPVAHNVFDFMEWLKAFGWGFISFPVVVYVIRTFGKQIWADVQGLWAKYVTKTPAA